jgi:hypothetical protein
MYKFISRTSFPNLKRRFLVIDFVVFHPRHCPCVWREHDMEEHPMSLTISPEKVEAVLLPDGKWYAIADHSFTLSPYEFGKDGEGIGKSPTATAAVGASWKDNMGKRFVCPASAMLAVRYS